MTQKTKKVMAHTRYKNADGDIVVGTTTVLNRLSKPALVPWANKLGLEGVAVGKYVDDKAEIGTLAHEMVHCLLKGEEADTSDYSQNQILSALNSLKSFNSWYDGVEIKPLLLEEKLVSEKWQYGGSVDCYALINRERVLVDFKTGKAIYNDMAYQIAAYKNLLEENGYPVDYAMILNIPRAETEDFAIKKWDNLDSQLTVFMCMLEVYRTEKFIKKGEKKNSKTHWEVINLNPVPIKVRECLHCGKEIPVSQKGNLKYCSTGVKRQPSECAKEGAKKKKRILKRKDTKLTKALPRIEKKEKVVCLKCDRKFNSMSKNNRICERCSVINEGVECHTYKMAPIKNKKS